MQVVMDKPLQGTGKAKLQEKKKLYRVNLKNEQKGKGMEGKFGTGGAKASAFVCGFPPRTAVQIKKSADNSGRKSKHSPESRRSP
ncbi:hypothetical protein AML91_27840 [Paenibacillus jilunlii]|uniref:Uncharacterized protein n=1 Tax=Paenibacillus jilunlii TaxID=682956 RepID=A0ABR5SK41_9BACL|nr:hypothetical protein AML91_27840 [Paenibacillus jilunlii]